MATADEAEVRRLPVEPPQRYRYSGRMGRHPGQMAFASLVGGVLLGSAYNGLLQLSETRLQFVALGLAGALLGAAHARLARALKCRNLRFVMLLALCSALLAVYMGFAMMANALLQARGLKASSSVFGPFGLWDALHTLTTRGMYREEGMPVNATAVRLWWTIGAALFVGLDGVLAYKTYSRCVFCERCKQWIEGSKRWIRFPVPAEREVLKQALAGKLEVLFSLPVPAERRYDLLPCLIVEFIMCPQCRDTGTYRLAMLTKNDTGWTRFVWREWERRHTGWFQLTPAAAQQLGSLVEFSRPSRKKGTAPSAPPRRAR